jgi:biotin carboxyl carrier protein
LSSATGRSVRVELRGPIELTVQLPAPAVPAAQLAPGVLVGRAADGLEVVVDGWRFEVTIEDSRHADLRELAARAAAEHGPHGETTLRAQIPGRVTRLWVAAGEAVEAGQRLLAVEAMKMENEVRAARAGTVTRVHVEPGSKVERNDPLVTLA